MLTTPAASPLPKTEQIGGCAYCAVRQQFGSQVELVTLLVLIMQQLAHLTCHTQVSHDNHQYDVHL